MKNKKVKGFLLLASCAMFLTGCNPDALWGLGGKWNSFAEGAKGFFDNIALKLGLKKAEQKEEQKEEEGKQEEQKEPSMVVAELPEKLYVGESLDLEQYVTLTNLSDFEVVLDEVSASVASVEGHSVKATGEGEIGFTVKAGEFSQACSLQGIYASRDALIKYFDGVKNTYTTAIYEPEYDDQDNYVGMELSDVILHDTNYILSMYQWSEDDQHNAIPGGFLRFGEEDASAYTFSIGEDANHQPEVILGDETSPLFLQSFNGNFGVDFSKAKYSYDAESQVEYYSISDKDASDFAENSCFIQYGEYDSTHTIDEVDFSIVNTAEEGQPESLVVQAILSVTDQEQLVPVMSASFFVEGEMVGNSLLQAYCVPANKPVKIDYWNYFGEGKSLDKYFLSNEGLFGATGTLKVEAGWFDSDTGAPMDLPEDYQSTDLAYMPVFETTYLSSPDSFWEMYQDYPYSGVMAVAGEDESKVIYNIKMGSESYIRESTEYQTIWENSKMTFGGLRKESNYEGAFKKVKEVKDENEQYLYHEFTLGQGFCNALTNTLIESCYDLGILGTIFKYYPSWISYFNGSLKINSETGVVIMDLGMGFTGIGDYTITVTSTPDSTVLADCQSWETFVYTNSVDAD